ncbi:MAG: class I SAM-dependent DNA methyltransferase [Acidimicrobiales bacterium]
MATPTISNHAAFIWSVADLLRGDYKQSEYGRVILPFTVLRRLDCVLDPTRAAVLARHARYGDRPDILVGAAGQPFYNTAAVALPRLLDDPTNLADGLRQYVAAFSPAAHDVMAKFDIDTQITRLDRSNLLYQVLGRFCDVDLHPDAVSNTEMGYLYEELVRRFSELSNETAGEHFTPREVVRLMVDLLFAEDDDLLRTPSIVKTMLDPACGTGGMLSVAQDRLRELNPTARLEVFGQELNAETFAVCQSDMLMKDAKHDPTRIVHGNSFSDDGHRGARFDYLLANPPFGVEWKKVGDAVRDEHEQLGFAGRFGAGLPRINDGSFLFLQHMISKMKAPADGGTRLAIVFNGSPLFTGAAGSGESEIRRWILEHDWLEAVVALPDQLFYNTGISTYVWIVSNRKAARRRGLVQLVDARARWTKMRKSLGEKRKAIAEDQLAEIVRLYAEMADGEHVKVLPVHRFGAQRITVERPMRRRWSVDDATLDVVRTHPKLVTKLDPVVLDGLLAKLAAHAGFTTTDRAAATKSLGATLALAGLTTAQQKLVVDALAVADPDAPPVTDRKGNLEPDPDVRDTESVPLPDVPVVYEVDVTARLAGPEHRELVEAHLRDEVLPYVPDAWVDHARTKLGYEIPLTRHFYRYVPPRPLAEIDAEIKQLEREIQDLLAAVTE